MSIVGRVLNRLSYANVLTTLALLLALGGASYAVVAIRAGSVGTRRLAFPLGMNTRGSLRARVVSRRGPMYGPTSARRCSKPPPFHPGETLAVWRMGAVHFFTATSGVGITAGSFVCFRQTKRGGGELSSQSQPVRLAFTRDGGRRWRVRGTRIPLARVARGELLGEQIVATSPGEVWALVGKGRLVASTDGGLRWHVQALPSPVAQIITSGAVVWAVTCPRARLRTAPFACRPQLWRDTSSARAWTHVRLPRVVAEDQSTLQLAATATDMIVEVLTGEGRGELLISRDAGKRWTKRPASAWDHQPCSTPAGLTAAPPHTFWLLCIGSGAAGSSTKGLLRTKDGGRTWTTVSAVPTLSGPPHPGSITAAEPSALAAGSNTRLWLSVTNGLTMSDDGGRRWVYSHAVDTGGWETVIDALNASHAWLLAPGAGMWRTTDGLHWDAIQPLNTDP